MFIMPRGIVGTAGELYARLTTRSRTRAPQAWPNLAVPLAEIHGRGVARGQLVLENERLTLRFGGLTAVDDVNLEVWSGTVHALIGPNGAGKSSVLNLISGFYQPTSGSISFFGSSIVGLPSHQLARMGIARTFQNTELFGQMTVLENVLVGFHAHIATRCSKPCSGSRALAARSATSCTRPASSSISSAFPAMPTRRRATCRSVTSAGSRSRARSRFGLSCCCSTSPPPA